MVWFCRAPPFCICSHPLYKAFYDCTKQPCNHGIRASWLSESSGEHWQRWRHFADKNVSVKAVILISFLHGAFTMLRRWLIRKKCSVSPPLPPPPSSAVSKVNQGLSVAADRSRDRENKCIFLKKQIDRCQHTFRSSRACRWARFSVALICWLDPQFETFPLPLAVPSPEPRTGCVVSVRSARARWVRGRARRRPAGEAAAAATAAAGAFTMELPGRGRGGACSEDGSRNGGSTGGTKERLPGWEGDVDVWLILSPDPAHYCRYETGALTLITPKQWFIITSMFDCALHQ